MAKRFLVCSGKGGVGKSTLTVCLARALCARGKRVLLVDGDTGLRTLDLLTGLGAGAVYSWQDVLNDACTLSDAMLFDESGQLALLIPSNRANERFDGEAFAALLKEALKDFDFCFLDAGAGIGESLFQLARAVDSAALVATPDHIAARAARQTAQMLESFVPACELRLLLNRYLPERVRYGDALSADTMIDETGVQLIGAIPEDPLLQKLDAGEIPAAKTAAAFDRVARRLLGEHVPFFGRR